MTHDVLLTAITRSALATTDPAETILRAMQLIKDAFPKYYWVGVYILHGDELHVGPYVGPTTDHVRIPVGRGVCGTAVAQNKNQIVGDVRMLENYLACNLQTRSEIVVLVRDEASGDSTAAATGDILGQIDIDSTEVSGFSLDDEAFLESVGTLLAPAMKTLRDARAK